MPGPVTQQQPLSTPAEDADVHSASDQYAARFSGRVGRWMLAVQGRLTLKMVRAFAPKNVLDVGGGHGQIAGPLLREGYAVTVLGSESAALHQVAQWKNVPNLTTATGPLLQLPYPDKSFDVVVCFRLLPHCDRWQELIAELCRVARTGVVADYPTEKSINMLTPMLFGMKKSVEKNTRPYTLFADEAIQAEFAKHGFTVGFRKREFFLPTVIHRMLKMPEISAALEFLPGVVGLTAWLGSPVIVGMKKRPS